MRLIDSSESGAVERDRASWLLHERLVLTSAVCQELLQSTRDDFADRRPRAALGLLSRWVRERYGAEGGTGAERRLKEMVVPDGDEGLYEELVAGAQVCKDLDMLCGADKDYEAEGDAARIRRSLHTWQQVVQRLRAEARREEAHRALGRDALRLVRRMPDRTVERWTISGWSDRWMLRHYSERDSHGARFESAGDGVLGVIGEFPQISCPRRGVIYEFTVRDDVDESLLAQALVPDGTEGAENPADWPEDLARPFVASAPSAVDGLPWVDRWVTINGRRLSMMRCGSDSLLVPRDVPAIDLDRMAEAVRAGEPYAFPW